MEKVNRAGLKTGPFFLICDNLRNLWLLLIINLCPLQCRRLCNLRVLSRRKGYMRKVAREAWFALKKVTGKAIWKVVGVGSKRSCRAGFVP